MINHTWHIRNLSRLVAGLVVMMLMHSCRLPADLGSSDHLKLTEKYSNVNDSTAGETVTPEWRNFFEDSLLVALIDTALKNNIDLKLATQRIWQAQASLNASKRNFFPDLNVKGSLGTIQHGDYTESGVGNFDTNLSPNISSEQHIPTPVPDLFLGVETSWEVGFAGKLRNRKKAAYHNLLASNHGKQFVQTQVVANVAKLYYELLAVDNELEIIRKNRIIQERALEIVDVQKESGQINELAVKQFDVQLLNTKALEADKIQQSIGIENTLNVLLGRFPQPIERSDTILIENQLDILKTGLPSNLLLNRPDILQAEQNLKANESQLLSVRAAYFPGLNLSAYLAFNGFNSAYFFNPASTAYMITGVVTAPLLNRRQITRDYWMQASHKKEAFLNYQQTVYTSVGEVSTYYNRMIGFERISNFKSQEVVQLGLATGIANDLFLTGFANYLEVLTVRRNVLDSEIQLTEAKKEFFRAYIDLYKAMGGGWK